MSPSRQNLALVVLLAAALCGCKRDEMADQPRGRPMRKTEFFADGTIARPLVAGTVPRRDGVVRTEFAANPQIMETTPTFPSPLSYEDLKRGQERYNIYCALCHGRTGDGDGIIVKRGFTAPPSLHEPRLRNAPPGHFVNVITNGWGAMYSYADRVSPEDRWRITGYIRALQLSRSIPVNQLAPEDRAMISATTQPMNPPAAQPTEAPRQ